MAENKLANPDDKPETPPQVQGLDPNLPAYHMVTQQTMGDVIKVLKGLPWEDVNTIMPQLLASPLANAGPKPE